MPSRVIHIRLDDWVILGCHDTLEAGGRETVNLPSSTIIKEVLTAFIRKMQQDERIPIYTKEERLARARELYEHEFDTDGYDPVDLFKEPEVEPESDLADIARQVARNIEAEGVPQNIKQKLTISAAVDKATEALRMDILKLASDSFEQIQKKAPKDRFIEWAAQQKEEYFSKAVAICYTNLSQDLWGSDNAGKIIQDLCKMHLPENSKGYDES